MVKLWRVALPGLVVVLASAALPAIGQASTAGLTQSHRVWSESTMLARPGETGHRAPIGTTFSFVLSRSAAVGFKFIQIARGRTRRSGRCGSLSRRDSRRRRCSMRIVRATLSFTGHPGLNSVIFEGWLSARRRLKLGRYELLVTANADGRHARLGTLSFKIVKGPAR